MPGSRSLWETVTTGAEQVAASMYKGIAPSDKTMNKMLNEQRLTDNSAKGRITTTSNQKKK